MPTARSACGTESWSTPLLVTERLDRSQPHRAPRRIQSADDRHTEREGEAPGERRRVVSRADQPRQRATANEHLRREYAEGAADAEREQADPDRLGQDHRADPAGRPADGAEDADLAR